jgi:hypothetical protein
MIIIQSGAIFNDEPLFDKQVFKTYKEKVVYILNHYIDIFDEESSLASSTELRWCLHVIKNDFLQISNSLMTTPRTSGKSRRFSKTQRNIG